MSSRFRLALLFFWITSAALSQAPKRILYFSHTAGFRHGSINAARDVLRNIDPARFTLTASEDLSLLRADRLREFDAIFFYTSGELALSAEQKADLLAYVRNGGGFAGAHSATDTLYSWPEYGELIGGYFVGHPWTQNVRIDIEDPDHPVTRGLRPSFPLLEEVYQFRAFDRRKTRVLLTLDTRTVNLRANGVNRNDGDFALAWVHQYGRGRVFYTALGHFDEVFRDANVQRLLRQGLEWITGLTDGDSAPRGATAKPTIGAVAEAAQYNTPGVLSPGSFVTVFGTNLTSGSTMATSLGSGRLAGTSVLLNDVALDIIYASPTQVNVLLPAALPAQPNLVVRAGVVNSEAPSLRIAPVTPGIFAVTSSPGARTLWCTGLGELDQSGSTRLRPTVAINRVAAEVLYSGLAPGFPGLYQVNVRATQTPQLSTMIRLDIGEAGASLTLP
jgi:uncharacterized protein (TIGR03437 family)